MRSFQPIILFLLGLAIAFALVASLQLDYIEAVLTSLDKTSKAWTLQKKPSSFYSTPSLYSFSYSPSTKCSQWIQLRQVFDPVIVSISFVPIQLMNKYFP
jgi:hypothetical protein